MKTANSKPWFMLMVFVMSALLWNVPPVPGAETVDHDLYGRLLGRYVKDGVVNYQGFKENEAILDQYLKLLEKTDTRTLSRNEQFAFYVNAYNAWTIKLILTGYPGIESIKDLGSIFKSPWKKKICRIDGRLLTLDNIEHDILRARFKDPRVHFAVNCASKGCPPLRSEPYRGKVLDQQLDDMTTRFINDPVWNHLEGDTLYASRIFDWFEGDFNDDVPGFFLKYAKGDLKRQLEEKRGDLRLKYLDYDWSLNDNY
ncbi:MAG: DUF547 domain-containing protein [Deltaproteobacteria bacterium]|nr:DUF547 domain-containing protein [Deltaproteobacteria bacterium]MBW2285174.1 DUF547 domain-containing protein [Deltaproteobacteria bacterium]